MFVQNTFPGLLYSNTLAKRSIHGTTLVMKNIREGHDIFVGDEVKDTYIHFWMLSTEVTSSTPESLTRVSLDASSIAGEVS